MPIDPIPLPDSFWLTDSAMHYANEMVTQHWTDMWNMINGAKHLLVTDSGSQDEGTANEQDAFYAGDAFAFAAETLYDVWTEMTTSWTSSGADSWQGPAATTFANLYNTLYAYVSQLQETAVQYSAAARDAGFAHQAAKADWFTYMYDWMYNTSHIREGIQNLVFDPASLFDFHFPAGGTGFPDVNWAPFRNLIANFENGYNWADTTFVMNYNSLFYIGYVAILPGLSAAYGQSYLALPAAPEESFPPVDKKNDPYAQEKDNLTKEANDLTSQEDLFKKQQADAEDAANAAQKNAQKQASDQEALLNKQQSDAQDAANAQQKALSDAAANQQNDLAKQQADAQDQMNAQQKQLADQAAQQQANLDNLAGNQANPNPVNVPAPDTTGLNVPGAGMPPPTNAPAIPTGAGPVPAGPSVVTAPDGTLGLDTNGMVTALPPTAKKIQTPNGAPALDLNGDGIPDTDLNGTAIPGGSAPSGSRLVTGPDGQAGYDINGDGVADLDLNGNALPGGSFPAGSRYVTGPDGRQGFDMTGNGIPDTNPLGVPLPNSPYFTTPQTPPLVTALPPTQVPALNPGNQVQMPPPAPGVTAPPGTAAPAVAAGPTPAAAAAAGGGGPAMYPPMGGMGMGMGMGQNQGDRNERERQTWLQEEDEVWAGDTSALTALAQMGRPVEDEEAPEEWEVPVRPTQRTAPRQPRPGQFPTGTRR